MTKDPTENGNDNLSGAYALNAVSADERAAYEALLGDSEQSRNKSTELADTAVILGIAADPVSPSPAMRAALLAQIAVTPQIQPDTAPAATEPVTDPTVAAATTGPATRKAQARWFQQPALAIASIAAAVAIVVGGVGIVTELNQPTQAPTASPMKQLTLASDKQEATVEVGDATATLLWSNSLGLSGLAVDGASEAPSGHVYQLWCIGDVDVRDAGVMTASVDDGSWQLLDGTMHAGDAVGVTVKPIGGSEKPTSTPIVIIAS